MNKWMNKCALGSLYKIKRPVLTESVVKNTGTIAKPLLNTLMMRGIDKQIRDRTDAKERAQNFVTGMADRQLGEIEYQRSQAVASVNDTCKLWMELSGKDNAKVRKLVGLAEGNNTSFNFAHQLKKRRMKIEYRGKPYNCTKCGNVINMINTSEIKYI